jgi:hypothetical protein
VKQLPITWRLVSLTGGRAIAVARLSRKSRAVATLQDVLRPLGIEPNPRDGRSNATFRADPPVQPHGCGDRWRTGWTHRRQQPCCSVCGDAECRTVEVGGTTFETIPERLLIRASLIAAAQLLE